MNYGFLNSCLISFANAGEEKERCFCMLHESSLRAENQRGTILYKSK